MGTDLKHEAMLPLQQNVLVTAPLWTGMGGKELLVDAIFGNCVPEENCQPTVPSRLVESFGDQHNWGYRWKKAALSELSTSELKALYSEVKAKTRQV